ncbi:MAG: MotA/TolQ/ExbB proton channel family protein [Pseudomonadota bacterium]
MAIRLLLLSLLIVATTVAGAADNVISLDELLKTVKAGRARDSEENKKRLESFAKNRAQQATLLAQAEASRDAEQARSVSLEREFESLDRQIAELSNTLDERLGSLKALFDVLQRTVGDTRGQFEASLTHVQYPERIEFLDELSQKMGQTSRLASVEEIERLWFELQREMVESGRVVRFDATVITADGNEALRPVIRIGAFNAVSAGKYLSFSPETGKLSEFPRQPQSRYTDRIDNFESAATGTNAPVGVDPSRGQILSLLVQAPSLEERIQQGGVVGYVILSLGLIAFLVAIERLIRLSMMSRAIDKQVKKKDELGKNPLGRVFRAYAKNKKADIETLELKLTEAILKETPAINRRQMLLKIIAVVAPLLGLLGTVTGMIITFQAITLFGTGDPKLMAGGISQALVTTVLGLCVAIPTVLLHTLVVSRGKRLTQILEQQAAGLVAHQAERRMKQSAA